MSATAGSPGPRSPSAPAGWPTTSTGRSRLPHRARRRWPATRAARTTWPSTCTTASSTSSAMVGAWKARVAPFNVNYRYVADELRYLLADAGATAIVVHSPFAPTLAEVRRSCRGSTSCPPGPRRVRPRACCRAPCGTRRPRRRPPTSRRRDAEPRRPLHPLHRRHHRHAQGRAVAQRRRHDRVLRRLADGARRSRLRRRGRRPARALITPPFMHGAGHWVALPSCSAAAPSLLPPTPSTSTPTTCGGTVERERIDFMLIVGDAFARPLLDELDRPTTTCPASTSCSPAAPRCRSGASRSCSPTCRR